MSALINFSIDLSKLPKDKIINGKKGKYINLTASINDETRYGNNVSFSLSQSQEQRQNKEPKTYVGNGKVVWNDGNIVNAQREEDIEVNGNTDPFEETYKKATDKSILEEQDDLPF